MRATAASRIIGLILGTCIASLLAAPAAVMFGATPASADNWPYGENAQGQVVDGFEPDRGSHTYCFQTGGAAPNALVRDRMDWSMGTVEAQTIVGILSHGNSCTGQTDVRLRQDYIANHIYARTQCTDINSSGRCDQWTLTLAYGEIQDDAASPPAEVRHSLCHEVGHTMALGHYGVNDPITVPPDGAGNHSCPRSGIWDGGQEWTKSYGAHHIGHVNTNW